MSRVHEASQERASQQLMRAQAAVQDIFAPGLCHVDWSGAQILEPRLKPEMWRRLKAAWASVPAGYRSGQGILLKFWCM